MTAESVRDSSTLLGQEGGAVGFDNASTGINQTLSLIYKIKE